MCLVEGRRRGGRSLKGLPDKRNSQFAFQLCRGSTPGNERMKSNTWPSVRFALQQMSSSGVGLNIWRASLCFNVCDWGIWCFPLPNTYQMTILVSTLVQSKAKVGENFYRWTNLGCVPSRMRTHNRWHGGKLSCDTWEHHVRSFFQCTVDISGIIRFHQLDSVGFMEIFSFQIRLLQKLHQKTPKNKLTCADLKKKKTKKKIFQWFCQQCEKHMFVPNFSSSVGRLNPSGLNFMVSLAKMCVVAGTNSASTEERAHAVLQSQLCTVEGTVWPFWTLFPVLVKSCWLAAKVTARRPWSTLVRCILCVLISSQLLEGLNNVITDMVWNRWIQYFVFSALMCIVSFVLIRGWCDNRSFYIKHH